MENGILLPSLRPMLPLLDLHDIRRLDFHNSILDVNYLTKKQRIEACIKIRISMIQELREKLISQINEIGKKEGKERDKKLKELLAKSFPVIKVKSLRPMVMCILSNTPHIEEKYLKVLVCSQK